MTLPDLDGKSTAVRSLAGRCGTVILLWAPDRWMARAALHDLTRDFTQLAADGAFGVVGVAVGQPVGAVRAVLAETGAAFPQLLDPDGQAFALVGDAHLPRIYVLDAQGRIVWFDIEYSEATRRELRQTLSALVR
jgi:ABC-type amino acid transport substrate-binding protein